MDKLLLLTKSEAAFQAELLELWVTIHAGEEGPKMDTARVDRFHIQRKLEGRYTAEEIERIGQVALGMMG